MQCNSCHRRYQYSRNSISCVCIYMAGHILNGLLPLSSTWNTNLHLWKWRLRVLSWKNRFYILCFLCTSDITNIWQFSNFSVSFLKSASRYNRNFENFYFVPVVYKNYHYVIQVFLCLSAPPSLPSISLPLLLSLSFFVAFLASLSISRLSAMMTSQSLIQQWRGATKSVPRLNILTRERKLEIASMTITIWINNIRKSSIKKWWSLPQVTFFNLFLFLSCLKAMYVCTLFVSSAVQKVITNLINDLSVKTQNWRNQFFSDSTLGECRIE